MNTILKLPGIVLLVICSMHIAFAQQGGVLRGRVLDSATQTPVVSATVTVFINGVTALPRGFTNDEGFFELKQVPLMDSLELRITYIGSVPYQSRLQLKKTMLDMGTILLSRKQETLQTVSITSSPPAVRIKNDTVEFNASSYKTGQGAVIEDLLKKMPGLAIDANGSLTYNGKKVSKIMVNGREFFGSDPKIAIQSLPADIVNKIQLIDTKSLQQTFSGLPPDGQDKTLNISLKKNVKDVVNITGGLGSDKRYEASGILSRFDKNMQLGIVGSANNINKVGFSSGLPGQSLSVIDAGNGITSSRLAGINYSNNWKEKLKLTGNYNYTNTSTDHSSSKERQQFLVPDSSFLSSNNSHATDGSQVHHVQLLLDYAPAALFHVTVTPIYDRTNLQTDNNSIQETNSSGGGKLNSGTGQQQGKGMSEQYGADILFLKGFKKTGRSVTLDINSSLHRDRRDDQNNTRNVFYRSGLTDSISEQFQKQLMNTNDYNLGLTLTYSEPLSKKTRLIMEQVLKWEKTDLGRNVYQTDSTGKSPVYDGTLSTAYVTQGTASNSGLSFAYTGTALKATVGAKAMTYRLGTDVQGQAGAFTRQGVNIVPLANVTYVPGKNQRIGLNFLSYVRQPAVQETQPVTNNSNPLFVTTGNPDLNPSLYTNYGLDYSLVNPRKGFLLISTLMYAPVQRDIISKVQYEPDGRQLTSFININGNYSMYFFLMAKQTFIKGETQKSITLSINARQAHQLGFINGNQTATNTQLLNPSLELGYSHGNIIDFSGSYAPSMNRMTYSNASIPKQDFMVQTLKANVRLTWPKVIELENTVVYNYNGQAPAGFKKDALLWNANIGKQLFKGAGLVRLTVYDLLKKNNNVSRVASGNFIEDTQSTVLQQYFMLSCNYKFGGR